MTRAMSRLLTPFIAALALLGAGCTSQQLYATGQQWRANECRRLADTAERDRCLRDARLPYDEYRRQADAAQP